MSNNVRITVTVLAVIAVVALIALFVKGDANNTPATCASQIVYNQQHSPNVYGKCDGLDANQIRTANDLANVG